MKALQNLTHPPEPQGNEKFVEFDSLLTRK